jgi:DNA-binding CsgD family transcriptional regulator
MNTGRTERTKQQIIAACHRGLDSLTLRRELAKLVHAVVPSDACSWTTTDPATGLMTNGYVEGYPAEAVAPWFRLEHLVPDYNKFSVLARSLWPVGVLSDATHGDLLRSPRIRELVQYSPGLGDELRVAFVIDSQCWGVALLGRMKPPFFTTHEANFLAAISSHVAEGLRAALLASALTEEPTPDGPGLVVLDTHHQIQTLTPDGSRWLDHLNDGYPSTSMLPGIVHEIAYRAHELTRSQPADGHEPPRLPRARVRTRSGTWLLVHGSALPGSATPEGHTAVIIERARSPEVAPLIVEAYGFTPREREVTRLVIRGLSTREIAADLFISPSTVQQHLKAIFAKTSVGSRRELVAEVFDRCYYPRTIAGGGKGQVGPNGWFDDPSAAPGR